MASKHIAIGIALVTYIILTLIIAMQMRKIDLRMVDPMNRKHVQDAKRAAMGIGIMCVILIIVFVAVYVMGKKYGEDSIMFTQASMMVPIVLLVCTILSLVMIISLARINRIRCHPFAAKAIINARSAAAWFLILSIGSMIWRWNVGQIYSVGQPQMQWTDEGDFRSLFGSRSRSRTRSAEF